MKVEDLFMAPGAWFQLQKTQRLKPFLDTNREGPDLFSIFNFNDLVSVLEVRDN